MQVNPQESALTIPSPPNAYVVAVAGAYAEMVVQWISGNPGEFCLAIWVPDLSLWRPIPESTITVDYRNTIRGIAWPNHDASAYYAVLRVQGDTVAAAAINSRDNLAACGSGGSGGITTFGPGLWIPDAPPVIASPDDEEFATSILDPRWNFHTTGRSGGPVTWLSDTLDEATIETGHTARYQLNPASNPSALVIQPGASATDEVGISRKLTAGTVPTNWILKMGMAYSANRETPTSPDMSLTLFMANDAPGNGFGDWDYQNQVCIYIQADYSGCAIRGLKTIAGVSTPFATGVALTTDDIPCQWQIKKTGDLYRVSVRFADNRKMIIMSDDLTGMGINPVRYGATFQAQATPNPTIPIAYFRHLFDAKGF